MRQEQKDPSAASNCTWRSPSPCILLYSNFSTLSLVSSGSAYMMALFGTTCAVEVSIADFEGASWMCIDPMMDPSSLGQKRAAP